MAAVIVDSVPHKPHEEKIKKKTPLFITCMLLLVLRLG
jgi:hypothetical protein